MRRYTSWAIRFVAPLLMPVVLLGGYVLFAHWQSNLYYPSLPRIYSAFKTTWSPHGLRLNAWPSLSNLLLGYPAGLLSAVLLGILVARLKALRVASEPIIAFFLALPSVAIVPIFIVLFGPGPGTKQLIIAQAVFFQVLVNVIDGLSTLDPTLAQSADLFKIRGFRRLFLVDLPGAGSQILAGARAGLSLGVLVMIVSELFNTRFGIGAVTLSAQSSFDFPTMWAGMVFTAIIGIGLNGLFSLAERPYLRRAGLLQTATGA
jgi:ABC-type nitrate/sulfonate/bicarbonate transport system permease component